MFIIGDRVRLKTGWTELEVVDIDRSGYYDMITAVYSASDKEAFKMGKYLRAKERKSTDFMFWDPDRDHGRLELKSHFKDTRKEKEMTNLYETTIDGKTVYATKLAVDSTGMWVMEPKGGGSPFAVDKKHCVEVLPYTVDVEFSSDSKQYAYFAKAGELAVGDLVINSESFSIVRVVKIDSKNKKATKWLEGVRLTGVNLTTE